MKTYQFPGALLVSVLALMGWVNSAVAWDIIPQNSYACHVTSSTAIPAVVLVQANDKSEAVDVAQRNKAMTFDGVPVQTASVVQCVLPPDEKFADAAFQLNFDKMDR